VFGSLVLPGGPGGIGGRTRFVSYGINPDGTYSGFIEDEGEPEPYFHLFVGGGEYTVNSADEMREVIEGTKDSKRRAEEKRLKRQEELGKMRERVAEWREYVFSQMEGKNKSSFVVKGMKG